MSEKTSKESQYSFTPPSSAQARAGGVTGRDKEIHDLLISIDKFWVDRMEFCNHYLKSMYYEQINMGKLRNQ